MALNSVSKLSLQIDAQPNPASLASLESMRKLLQDMILLQKQAQTSMKSTQTSTNADIIANKKALAGVNAELTKQKLELKDVNQIRKELKSGLWNISGTGKTNAQALREAEASRAAIQDNIRVLEQEKAAIVGNRNALNDLKANQTASLKSVNETIKETTAKLRDSEKAANQHAQAEKRYQSQVQAAEKMLANAYREDKARTIAKEKMYNDAYAEDKVRTAAREKMYQDAVNEDKARTAALQKARNDAYAEEAKRNAQFEKQRLSAMRQASEMAAKTNKIPLLSKQFRDIEDGLQRVNVKTLAGQKALERYSAALKQANTQFYRGRAQMDNFAHSWEKFKMILERVRDALLSFVIISTVQRVIVGFFTSLISSNQALEVLRARLSSLLPTAEEVKEVWLELQQLTITTPFKIQDFVEASTLVKAFGVDIKSNMAAISDWSTAVGRDLKDTAVAFGKIVSFSPRTALLLSTRGFSLSMYESYITKFGDRTLALVNMIQDQFGGMSQKISLTFEGILSNLSDLWVFISQTLGQPLFESLKTDLKTIYSLMDDLRKSNSWFLDFMGILTSVLTRGAGIAIFATSIGLVTVQVMKFIASVKAASPATIAWVKSFQLSVVATGITVLVWQLIKAADATKRLNELQKEYTTLVGQSTEKQIANLNEQIEILESQIGFWDVLLSRVNDFLQLLSYISNFSDIAPDLRSFTQEMNLRKETLANLKEELRIKQEIRHQEKLARIEAMGKVNILQDKDLLQKVQEFGMGDFFKELANSAEKNLPVIEKALKDIVEYKKNWRLTHPLSMISEMPTVKADINGVKYTEKELELLRAQVLMRKTLMVELTQGYDKEKAIAQIKDTLRQKLSMLSREMLGGEQAAANLRDDIAALFEFLESEKGAGGAKKAIINLEELERKFKDLLALLAGEKSQFESFWVGEDTAKLSKLAELRGKLEERLGTKNLSKENLSAVFAETEALALQYAERTPEQKQILLDLLDEQLKKEQEINQYYQAQFDIATQVKDLMTSHNEKLADLANGYRDLAKSMLEFQYGVGQIDTETYSGKLLDERNKAEKDNLRIQEKISELTNAEAANPIEKIKNMINIVDLERDRLNNLKDIFSILQEMVNLPATNWSDAFFKEFSILRNELESWRNDIVETFSSNLSGAIAGTIRELVSGAEAAGIDEQIYGLQDQLVEARNKKAEILGLQKQTTIVEDEEAKILAQINELEAQRSRIILDKFLTVFDTVFKKVEELASDKIVMWLMGELSAGSPIQAEIARVGELYATAGLGATSLVALSLQDYYIALDRLNVERRIAATKSGADTLGALMQLVGKASSGLREGDIPIVGDPWGGVQANRKMNVPIERTLATPAPRAGKTINIVFSGPVYGQKDFNKAVDEATRKIRSKVV